jgi:hypothetical protein
LRQSDSDNFPDYRDPDSDADGLPDWVEAGCTSRNCETDNIDWANHILPNSDNDNPVVPDYRDHDSDNDTIPDSVEAVCSRGGGTPCDTDQDVAPDYRDMDSDDDGVPDLAEAGDPQDAGNFPHDSNHDSLPDYRDSSQQSVRPPSHGDWGACTYGWFGYDSGVECGAQMILHTLLNAGVITSTNVFTDDPPIPGMLFSANPARLTSPGSASASISITATHPTAALDASLAVPYTILNGDLSMTWASDSWLAGQFTSLSAPSAQVYDENNTLIAEGKVQVAPAEEGSGVVLALGETLTYTISGEGSTTFYAPATDGLGLGGQWITYTAHIASASPYGLGLQNAIVTVDGQEYRGDLVLVTSREITFSGTGRTIAPNFSAQAVIQANGANITLGPASLLNGTFPYLTEHAPFDDAQGGPRSISGYTGPITLTEHTSTLDRLDLTGTPAFDLGLQLVPASSAITPAETASFQAQVFTSRSGEYTLTAIPPLGWQAQVDDTGWVTIIPSLDAAPGVYTVTVGVTPPVQGGAGGGSASALHHITILSMNGMALSAAPDPLTTVPWGIPITPPIGELSMGGAGGGSVNNGTAQIPGTAYLATITNTSTIAHTFAVTVVPDGFPSEWIMLGGVGRGVTTTLTLPAGGVGRLGIYIAPERLASLPAAGTQYPFNVQAVTSDEPSLSQSVSQVFVMPSVPFHYLQAQPDEVIAANGYPVDFAISLLNVGNAAGEFEINLDAPSSWAITPTLPYTVTLSPGQPITSTATFTPSGATPGDEELVTAASSLPGNPYIVRDDVRVRIVGQCVYETYLAARQAVISGDVMLAGSLQDLALQLSRWELEESNLSLRQRVIDSLNALLTADSFISHFAPHTPRNTKNATLITSLENLASAPSVAGFCQPASEIANGLAVLRQYGVAARFIPVAAAALPGDLVTYTLRIQNQGTLTNTYAITITAAPGLNFTEHATRITLPPNATISHTVTISGTQLGLYPLSAVITPLGPAIEALPFVPTVQAGALFKVVDRLIQVVSVTANPDFVEVGPNRADLYADVANVAGVYVAGVARVGIQAPDGQVVYTDTLPVTLVPALELQSLDLGEVSTSGWAEGVYTITLNIVDAANRPVRNGDGFGHLLVGVGVQASAGVWPQVVLPGTATVTMGITTTRTAAVGEGLNGLGNVYTFYLPTGGSDAMDGFYIVGLRPLTQYLLQQFDESARRWATIPDAQGVVTRTIAMDDIQLYYTGFPPDRLYRVYADNPALIVVTSGEGSLVSAVTPDLKFKGQHFTFLGDYNNITDSKATIFALENNTAITIELKSYGGNWGAPVYNTLNAGQYWYFNGNTNGSTVVRVTSNKDTIVYRNSADNDELDAAIADTGTPYGKTFYFAPVPGQYPDVFLLFNMEQQDAVAVKIYNITSNATQPPVVWSGSVAALGAKYVHLGNPSGNTFYKIVSDRTLSVIGGGLIDTQINPGVAAADAIWEILGSPMGNRTLYQTNLLYSRGFSLVNEYSEFTTGLTGQTNIQTDIPLADKAEELLWSGNTLNYIASQPLTITIEVAATMEPEGFYRHEEYQAIRYRPSTWQRVAYSRASQGYIAGANQVGQTASLSFDGSWVGRASSPTAMAARLKSSLIMSATGLWSCTAVTKTSRAFTSAISLLALTSSALRF